MTPRQADVAFVLEGVLGIRAVYSIAHEKVDFAIEVEQSNGNTGSRTIVEAHYALLRAMSHEDTARVHFVRTTVPNVFAASARQLRLTDAERAAARQRIPPPAVAPPLPDDTDRTSTRPKTALVVDEDQDLVDVVREVLECTPASERCVVTVSLDEAVRMATSAGSFDLILCDGRRAFGSFGLLARLPLSDAARVLVLANPEDLADARWRLQGAERILTRPVESWLLRDRIAHLQALGGSKPNAARRFAEARPTARRLAAPPPDAPFTAHLIGFDDDELHEGLRRVFHGESRHTICSDPEDAAEVAFRGAFHVILISMRALLHRCGLLDALAREDPDGANRALVLARPSDMAYVKHKLVQLRRLNRVLAAPVDDTTLRDAVLRRHPRLNTRVALDEASREPLPRSPRVKYRRLAMLVVDDDTITEVLFAAADARDDADVALASTPMDAFEHIVSRPVDLLVVSATMRSDGGEPFYRVLWRLKPELKGRSVLIVAPEAAPPSRSPHVLERPVTREALERLIQSLR
jgi:CheY-like chemotaxis protein